MFITSIAKQLRVCLVCRSSEIKILGQSNLVQECKQFVTALTITWHFNTYLSWHYDAEMSSCAPQARYMLRYNKRLLRNTFLKNCYSLFATLPNC